MLQMWWIPIVIVFGLVLAGLSVKNNEVGGNWFYVLYVFGIIQLWPFVSRYSKNLVFDGLLYDTILVLTYSTVVIFLSKGKTFSTVNYAGVGIVIIGLILMKIEN
jgi:hypothetical protein